MLAQKQLRQRSKLTAWAFFHVMPVSFPSWPLALQFIPKMMTHIFFSSTVAVWAILHIFHLTYDRNIQRSSRCKKGKTLPVFQKRCYATITKAWQINLILLTISAPSVQTTPVSNLSLESWDRSKQIRWHLSSGLRIGMNPWMKGGSCSFPLFSTCERPV